MPFFTHSHIVLTHSEHSFYELDVIVTFYFEF